MGNKYSGAGYITTLCAPVGRTHLCVALLSLHKLSFIWVKHESLIDISSFSPVQSTPYVSL